MEYYLVINLGLRSIRAIIFDEKVQILAQNWYPVQTVIQGDRVEQDPNEWWALCLQLMSEVLQKDPSYKKNLKAITITSSAACLVVLDKKGVPLTNSLMVSDKRATAQSANLKKEKSLETVFTHSKNLAVPSFMFPKILWIKEHLPHIFKQRPFFMSSNDFFIYKLTDKVLTDTLNAEKFYYDSKKDQYPPELLRYMNLNKKQLPTVVKPGTIAGTLVPSLQKQFGLPQNVKVIVSTYDAICAFLGSGALAEGETCNVCGTVSSVRTYTEKNNLHCKNGILQQQFQTFNIVGGSNNLDGGLLEWAKDMFYGDSYPEKYVYKIMENEAEASPAGARGLIFSPYIIGERVPFFDTVTRGIFFGLERFHSRSDIMRSIFEASGYMVHDIIQNIEESGATVKTIRMSGGLVQNKVACKIRANITGKKVSVIKEIETTSLGALFIMLHTLGKIKRLSDSTKYVQIGTEYKPDKEAHKLHQKMFTFFKKVYDHNRILMDERKKLLSIVDGKEKHILANL